MLWEFPLKIKTIITCQVYSFKLYGQDKREYSKHTEHFTSLSQCTDQILLEINIEAKTGPVKTRVS